MGLTSWVSEGRKHQRGSAVSRDGHTAESGTHSVVRFAVVPLSGEIRERKHFALPMFNIREKFGSVKSAGENRSRGAPVPGVRVRECDS
jgi:hypothetical protein